MVRHESLVCDIQCLVSGVSYRVRMMLRYGQWGMEEVESEVWEVGEHDQHIQADGASRQRSITDSPDAKIRQTTIL